MSVRRLNCRQLDELDQRDFAVARNLLDLRVEVHSYRSAMYSIYPELTKILGGPVEILELGAGVGSSASILTKVVDFDRYVGIDVSKKAVAVSRARFLDIQNISFMCASAENLPFDNYSFDLAIFHTVLAHVDCIKAATSEAYRVLKRGGVLVISDFEYSHFEQELKDEYYSGVNSLSCSMVKRLIGKAGFLELDHRRTVLHVTAEEHLPSIVETNLPLDQGLPFFSSVSKKP